MANETARALRKRMTPQEVKLWVKPRELKALGFHFRRQAPIGHFIVDFVSFGSRLIVEADGGQHGIASGRTVRRDPRRILAIARFPGAAILEFGRRHQSDGRHGNHSERVETPPTRPAFGRPPSPPLASLTEGGIRPMPLRLLNSDYSKLTPVFLLPPPSAAAQGGEGGRPKAGRVGVSMANETARALRNRGGGRLGTRARQFCSRTPSIITVAAEPAPMTLESRMS